jgi:hypothetical protein
MKGPEASLDWLGVQEICMQQGMGPLAAVGLTMMFLWMVFGVLSLVYLILQIMMIFSVFAIRKRVDEQQAVLDRIERHLGTIAEHSRPVDLAPPPPIRSP